MRTKVTDTILPTTMIGSYPKPRWFEEYNLEGADLLEWWKLEKHFHAYRDAVRGDGTTFPGQRAEL
jgi:methionine synthase II (cobalamin-independent)